jgi:poly(A) polymerase
VLLAALLLPISRAAPVTPADPDARPTVAQGIEDLLTQLVRTARLPRRIAERCRMILVAQRTLSGDRKRRGPLVAFRRHPLFDEALAVFELSVEATGEHREELAAWRAGSAPTPKEGGEGPRRRKRRRRRGPRPPDGGGPPS